MSDLIQEVLKLVAAFLGGATIGSLVTFKITRSSADHNVNRTVSQSRITAGRDNIGGDVKGR